MAVSNQRPINVLSLDGGSNGLPALYLLEEMFSRLKFDRKSEDELRPCDYFDMIGGSGTGGLIALLLGRLHTSISQAIEAYMKLAPVLSLSPADDEEGRKANSATFERAFLEVLRDAGMDFNGSILDDNSPKTLAYTLDAASMSTAYPLRTYVTRTSNSPPCTILQAACACIAFPSTFASVTIGEGHRQVTLVDSTIGYANPISELLREAKEAFGGEVKVSTIVSLGVETKVIHSPDSHEMELLRRVNVDCERVHEEMQTRLGESGVYHRFRLEHRFGTPNKDAFGHVSAYLRQASVSSAVDAVAKSVQTRATGPSLHDITSITSIEITLKPRPSLVRNFIGREDILDAMRQTHFEIHSSNMFGPSISVLSGLGGSGKTQITLKFACEYEDRYPDAPVYFIDGSSETTLKTDLETIIRSQGPNYRSASYEDALVWLATKSKQWLLIVDNVDDPSVKLSSFIPRCFHGHIIVTTRDATRRILAPDSTHDVEGLSATDSVMLLLKTSGYESNPTNQARAKEMVDELGHLPLALAHAGAYISIHQCLPTFLSTYRQSRAQLLGNYPDLVQGYPRSVAATIQMSLEQLPPSARDLLRIFAHLDARSIAYSVISKAAERCFRHVEWTYEDALQLATTQQASILMKIFCPSQEWVPATFDQIISACLRYSLLRVVTQNDERFYSMHVLVQNYLQDSAHSEQGHAFSHLATRLLGSAVTTNVYQYDHFAFNRLLFPHLRLIDLENVVEPGDHYGFGRVLKEMGDWAMAIAHLEQCVEQWKQSMGDEDENTLYAMKELGHCYANVGREEEALEIRKRALEISKRVWGDEDRITLGNMHNLANSYSKAGRDQEALELREIVLENRKELLGDEHRHTLSAMINLAVSYSAVGRFQEALELEEIVVDKRKGLLGDEHPDTLNATGNLASSYFKMRRYQEALPIRRYVLTKLAATLGEEHPSTLLEMYNLLITYRQLQMVTELETLLCTALPLFERVLGVDHTRTQGLRDWHVAVRSRATKRGINETTADVPNSNTVSPPEIRSNGKRKRSSQGLGENNKRRK